MKLSNIKRLINEIDHYLSNLFIAERLFEIDLYNCTDEFGNRFGSDNHFLSKVLNIEKYEDKIIFLKNYYEKNKIKNINQMLGYNIKNIYGNFYFCPWEEGRLRKLDRLLVSPKIGPTTNETIKEILFRLINLKDSIRENGYRKHLKHKKYIRVIKIIDRNKKTRYLVRDGQHRCSVLSFYRYKKITAIDECIFWQKSKILNYLIYIFKILFKKKPRQQLLVPKEINFLNSQNWPYVKAGILTQSEAEKIFDLKFKSLFN